jgi:hypothetical protein
MYPVARNCVLGCCALVTVLSGCNNNPAVTVSATFLEKKGAEPVEAGSVAVMTSDRAGATIGVGGSSDGQITAKIAKIADSHVLINIAHPKFKVQQVNIKLGESRDAFFGDGSSGVRLRFTEAR